MSSILDALNKLEQEKAQSQKEARERNIDAKVAADELLGRRRPQEAASIRLRPAVMVGGGLLALALIVGMSAGISVLVLRGAAPATGTPVSASVRATVEPTPESEPETAALAPGKKPDTTEAPSVAAEAGPSRATVASVVEKRPTPSAAPDSTPSVNAPLTQRSVVAKADTREIATPLATSSPKKAPTRDSSLSGGTSRQSLSESASRTRTRREQPAPADPEPTPAREVLLRTLPILAPSDATRYGLDKLVVNMVIPQDDRHPYANAIINQIQVYEGRRIPGSTLSLFKVESYGIGIESSSGDRYFVRF